MATLEEFREAWETQSQKIDEVLQLNRRLLMADRVKQVRSPMRKFLFTLFIEIGTATAMIGVLGWFIGQHVAEPRFIWPAALLDVWAIFNLVGSIRQLIVARKIDYSGPVAAIQHQLAELRVLRIQNFRWALLTGQVACWIPALIVSLELFCGIDAYRYMDALFILVNLAFGIAVIPIAIAVAKRVEGHTQFWRRLGDGIAGRTLTAAQHQVSTLSDFISIES